MSIRDMKESLGIRDITMRYEDGGKTEVYTAGGIEYRVPGGTSVHTVTSIIAEGRKALGPNAN